MQHCRRKRAPRPFHGRENQSAVETGPSRLIRSTTTTNREYTSDLPMLGAVTQVDEVCDEPMLPNSPSLATLAWHV